MCVCVWLCYIAEIVHSIAMKVNSSLGVFAEIRVNYVLQELKYY